MATYNGHNEDSSGNILLSIGNGMTATVETGSTASQAYTKGSYLFFNNRLCKATSAIASGATLAVGTNLSQTSIGQELTSHLRSSDGKEFYFDVKDGTYGYYPSASKTASEFVPFGGTPQIDGIVFGGTWGVTVSQVGFDMNNMTITSTTGAGTETTHVKGDYVSGVGLTLKAKTAGYYLYTVSGTANLTKGNLSAGTTIYGTSSGQNIGIMIYLGS